MHLRFQIVFGTDHADVDISFLRKAAGLSPAYHSPFKYQLGIPQYPYPHHLLAVLSSTSPQLPRAS